MFPSGMEAVRWYSIVQITFYPLASPWDYHRSLPLVQAFSAVIVPILLSSGASKLTMALAQKAFICSDDCCSELRHKGSLSSLRGNGRCSLRSYELDVLALWVWFLLSKLRLASCFSSICIYHSTINVGATCPNLNMELNRAQLLIHDDRAMKKFRSKHGILANVTTERPRPNDVPCVVANNPDRIPVCIWLIYHARF
ncbi:hypothetical protein Acr_06g0007660 [Actinidia rufa]|uniref:Uncharacterized protein n=1 Tax=Actinidia rufa TaxID=165716 RepID=A0A7J0ERJ8_9ERIC|nr:hypothetical protein Acr_06g0007660 [Actinidia rufa]